jgi:GNAT superfamily N-acetyltransferase
MKIIMAKSESDIKEARTLFEEYAAWLEISLCFQNFDRELAGLPGEYAAPDGRLLLAFDDDQLAGCIALRKIRATTCEMKRLFLRPEFRGRGFGRVLVKRVIEEARQMGYTQMCLDTLPGRMDQAIALYKSIGFKEIEPYYNNAVAGATFMELRLV